MHSSAFSQVVFWLAASVCAVAQVAVVRAALAGRTPGASLTLASRVREMFWVFLPAAVLAVVLVWTWRELPGRSPALANPAVGVGVASAARHVDR